jgi:hypothetical protein
MSQVRFEPTTPVFEQGKTVFYKSEIKFIMCRYPNKKLRTQWGIGIWKELKPEVGLGEGMQRVNLPIE